MSFADVQGTRAGDARDACEHSIMEVIRGDQRRVIRGNGMESARAWIDPAITEREAAQVRPAPHDPGTSGPEEARMQIHRGGRRWREIRA